MLILYSKSFPFPHRIRGMKFNRLKFQCNQKRSSSIDFHNNLLRDNCQSKKYYISNMNKYFEIMEAKESAYDIFLDDAIENDSLEPFGIMTWNSSHTASFLLEHFNHLNIFQLQNMSVCDVGCGTGLSSVVALSKGAKVYALDKNRVSLQLVEASLKRNQLLSSPSISWGQLSSIYFDVEDETNKLPDCDLYIFSDIMYYDTFARICAHRCHQLLLHKKIVLITDPKRLTSQVFVDELKRLISANSPSDFSLQCFDPKTSKMNSLNTNDFSTLQFVEFQEITDKESGANFMLISSSLNP